MRAAFVVAAVLCLVALPVFGASSCQLCNHFTMILGTTQYQWASCEGSGNVADCVASGNSCSSAFYVWPVVMDAGYMMCDPGGKGQLPYSDASARDIDARLRELHLRQPVLSIPNPNERP